MIFFVKLISTISGGLRDDFKIEFCQYSGKKGFKLNPVLYDVNVWDYLKRSPYL